MEFLDQEILGMSVLAWLELGGITLALNLPRSIRFKRLIHKT